MMPVEFSELTQENQEESSAQVRHRVEAARKKQHQRFGDSGIFCNAAISSGKLREFCPMQPQAAEFLKRSFEKMGMSARAYDRVVKVARTVADLENSDLILKSHIAQALAYRSLDQKYWGR